MKVQTSVDSASDSDISSAASSFTDPSETTENTDSKYVISPRFDDASPFNSAGYAVVGEYLNSEMKYGVIDEAGTNIVESRFDAYDMPSFELLRKTNIDDSIIWVREGEFWSIINESGEWLSDHLF